MLSIVTATYNSAPCIDRLYASLCAQDPELFEWGVVDDRSSDDTFERVRVLVKTAPFRARAWRLPVNSGGPVAQAYGFLAAEGELACHIDHDDQLVPDAVAGLARVWREAERTGGYGGVFLRSLDGASGRLNGKSMRPGGRGHGVGPDQLPAQPLRRRLCAATRSCWWRTTRPTCTSSRAA